MSSRRTARRSADLMKYGIVDEVHAKEIDQVSKEFSMAITPQVLDLIDPSDVDDPIARQYVPSSAELVTTAEELVDPIGDDSFEAVPGVVHRYPDRVLLKPLHVCSVYCRFCFRREKVGPGAEHLSTDQLNRAFDYIRDHEEIWEVILTGGDPLILHPRRLNEITDTLSNIKHVGIVRIHSRIPIADSSRITSGLIDALRIEKPLYLIVHCNHPAELTDDVRRATALFVDAGIPVLSQSVLLRGVNDDPKTMEKLMRSLVLLRIKPYYLHHGDLARGTSHFRTTIEEGREIMRALRGRVSGLCQPAYVLDIPNGMGKVPIGPSYLTADGPSTYLVEDYRGRKHRYPPAKSEASHSKADPVPSDHGAGQ